MKISYINGCCVKNDAISNSVRDEVTWLSSDVSNNVRLYTYACDYKDLPFVKVSDFKDIAFDPHFQSSELVVFHFGIFCPLFNLLPVVPASAKRLVVFHNITPKQFVNVEQQSLIDKSFHQMSNILFADHVVCVSQTNLDVLRSADIQTPATVLPLAVHTHAQAPETKPSALDGIVRLAFVGRFVKSKGPDELLEALDAMLQCKPSMHVRVDMIGNLSFSDSTLLEEIQKAVDAMHRSHSARLTITIHGNASEKTKNQILRDADLFVLPSYHEGFCVPILEALASGCRVISYDNSNIPAISGGLAILVQTGNVTALSKFILEVAEQTTSTAWHGRGAESYEAYRKKSEEYVLQYAPEQTKRRFLKFIKNFVL